MTSRAPPGVDAQVPVEPDRRPVRPPADLGLGDADRSSGSGCSASRRRRASGNLAASGSAWRRSRSCSPRTTSLATASTCRRSTGSDQALYAGTRIGAFRVATMVGSSFLVVLAARTSWQLGFGAAGVLMFLTAATTSAVMPHPPEHKASGATPHAGGVAKVRAFGEAYRTFLTQPNAALVLAFLLFYRVGDIMMFGMAKFFLRDIGIDTAHRGVLNGFSIGASILGAIVGGAIISRKGLARCLTPMAFLQNLAIPLYFGMAIVQAELRGHRSDRSRRAVRRGRRANGVLGVPDAALPRRFLGGALRVHHGDRGRGQHAERNLRGPAQHAGSAGRCSSRSASSRACPAWCWCSSSRRRRSNRRPRRG